MSTRYQPGDWVWLKPCVGFVGESDQLPAQIQPEDDPAPCIVDCGDPDCVEWATLFTAPDPAHDGQQHVLCHVCECQILSKAHPTRQKGPSR